MSQLNFFYLATTEKKNLCKKDGIKTQNETKQNNESFISANGITVQWVGVLIFLLLRCT